MKEFVGKVISDRAQKTILVAVDRWWVVPKYRKRIRRTSKFMAHDEHDECRMGDIVRIHISRPLSKNKTWRMTEILRREKVYDAEAAGRDVEEHQHQEQQLPPSLRPQPDPAYASPPTPEAAAAEAAALATASRQQPLSRGFAASAAL